MFFYFSLQQHFSRQDFFDRKVLWLELQWEFAIGSELTRNTYDFLEETCCLHLYFGNISIFFPRMNEREKTFSRGIEGLRQDFAVVERPEFVRLLTFSIWNIFGILRDSPNYGWLQVHIPWLRPNNGFVEETLPPARDAFLPFPRQVKFYFRRDSDKRCPAVNALLPILKNDQNDTFELLPLKFLF